MGFVHCLRAPPTRGGPQLVRFKLFFFKSDKKKFRNPKRDSPDNHALKKIFRNPKRDSPDNHALNHGPHNYLRIYNIYIHIYIHNTCIKNPTRKNPHWRWSKLPI